MNSYIQQLFPFVDMGDFIRNTTEVVDAREVYCPVEFEISDTMNVVTRAQNRPFNSYKITPCNKIVIDESDTVLEDIKKGVYGDSLKLNITEVDYTNVASRIEVTDDVACIRMNQGHMTQNILSDIFINATSNGFKITDDLVPDVKVKASKRISFKDWVESVNPEKISESADSYQDLLKDFKDKGELTSTSSKKVDSVYEWLDAYFALPEGAATKARSEVPLLIGPTGVFKSSTVKELCKKYGYRLVDFRVAFTSRLDYSGLYQMGTVDDKTYSYACPMEELVTCSDGFRQYCSRAYDKIVKILSDGYLVADKTSNGETTEGTQVQLTDEQRAKLEELLSKYKEYMKPVCLFVDEITRCFSADTEVRLADDRIMTMKELYDTYSTDKEFYVYACDENGGAIAVAAHSLGITRRDAEMVKVTLDNGYEVECTPDHRWMLEDGSYAEARDLESGTALKGLCFDSDTDEDNTCTVCVESVEDLNVTMDAYDIEVPQYHNFLIDLGDELGVFVHNCKDSSVNGVLTEMLNQKRFNNMPMKECKFVAATNANLISRTDQRHNQYMDELDDMYDVNDDLDIAFSNRFIPLLVRPEDVQERWFDWATSKGKSAKDGSGNVENIHPMVIDYLTTDGFDQVYNDGPVLDAIESGLTDNETKSQPFPNYRTWEMVSDYLYTVDEDYNLALKSAEAEKDRSEIKKVYRPQVINGLISEKSGVLFIKFLEDRGYVSIETSLGKEVDDEYSDFLQTSLDAGVPALMVGPSSIGKSARVQQYLKRQKDKTGLEPVLINIDLASKDAVDLMGMPTKVSLVNYVAGDLDKEGFSDLRQELVETVKSVQAEDQYGLSDFLTVRSPDLDVKNALIKAQKEGREVVFFFDECNRVKSSTVLSSIFECISDKRYAGVSFEGMEDKVKVVAACNMSHSEMKSDDVDYSEAGSIDPALAARFSVFWKKNYDEKDVKSWIAYMENEKAKGTIDGTLLDFFKGLPMERCIEIISSVEKRQLSYAEPSTRSMTQLSRDIKSMRGVSGSTDTKLYYGKLLFDSMTRNSLGDIYDSGGDEIDVANKIIKLAEELLDNKDTWDAVISGSEITINNRTLKAEDVLDNLDACIKDIKDIISGPVTQEKREELGSLNQFALTLMQYCNNMDDGIMQKRRAFFEQYLGEEFTKDFLPFFNENFGSENDEEITIEMLSDKTLVKPFFKKLRSRSASLSEEQYEDKLLDLMKEFLAVHGTSLAPDVYVAFIDGLRNSLASTDGMDRILKNVEEDLDPLFEKAEQFGDAWVVDMLMSLRISLADVAQLRGELTAQGLATRASANRATLL